MAQELTERDAALREDANKGATETLTALAQKKQAGKQKVRRGIFGLLTVVGALILTAATGGLAAPLVTVAAVKAAKDTANLIEGAQDIYKANRGDLSPSLNFIRDTVFQGNEEAYQFACTVTDITFDIVAGKAIKGGLSNYKGANKIIKLINKTGSLCDKSKLSNFAVNIGGDMLTGCDLYNFNKLV